ncbi:hypothetical protein [Dictyoglomus turgidum]|uniref:hypothetical protein n=1 Tax=Dictyoglomus turgidum TaxID=513050 RepID=UPI0023556D4F|nr:hypothetical protein [Dictyoglomus turgidum]
MKEFMYLLERVKPEFENLPAALLNAERFIKKLRNEKATGVIIYNSDNGRGAIFVFEGKAFFAKVENNKVLEGTEAVDFIMRQIQQGYGKITYYPTDMVLILVLSAIYVGTPLYVDLDANTIIPTKFFTALQNREFSGVVLYRSAEDVKFWIFKKGKATNPPPVILPPYGFISVYALDTIEVKDYLELWEQEARRKIIEFSEKLLSAIARTLVEKWGQNTTELMLLPLESYQGPINIKFDKKTWSCKIESNEELYYLAKEIERLYARLLRAIREREEIVAENVELYTFNLMQEENVLWPPTEENVFRRD